MATIAGALAREVARRGFVTGIRFETEKSAAVCVIEAKRESTILFDGEEEIEDLKFSVVGIEVWDFGLDMAGNTDVRWSDAAGHFHEYSVAPAAVNIVALADRIVGPEENPPLDQLEFAQLS